MSLDDRASVRGKKIEIAIAGDRSNQLDHFGAGSRLTPTGQQWRDIERSREKRLQNPSSHLSARLRRRAFWVAKSLPVLPGQRILELGAGGGIWTEHLAAVLDGQSLLSAAVFNRDLADVTQSKNLPNTEFICIDDIRSDFPPECFDCVVGTDILTDELWPSTLGFVYRCLKPGGQFLFFARNASNPLARMRKVVSGFRKRKESDGLQQAISSQDCIDEAVRRGFDGVEFDLSEVISPLEGAVGHAIGLILERAPVTGRFSSVVSLRGAKPGSMTHQGGSPASLAMHPQLFGAVSVVVPCHNEDVNIERLVSTLVGMYDAYLHEIVIVDDNSSDHTAEVAAAVACEEPRVKLVERNPPGGVGRALRDGYAAATGKYILSIDCDFITIASEFRGLFDAVAEGYDGAIGSRFSSESALVRYPFFKILCNRGYHLLLNLLLGRRVRDISNNLKLYRAEILKGLDIEEPRFAANVETGLKPLLLNYRIREVPASWINRTADMGKSSFNLLKVGPDYLKVLIRTTWRYWRGECRTSR